MKFQKLTAGLLALSMLGAPSAGAVQMLTAAAEETETAPTSGTCGENLTWKFDESTGTLTISGTGEMDDFVFSPWYGARLAENIQTVVIEDGVTNIQSGAFAECTSLTDITIPGSIMSIGTGAFYNTPWLMEKQAENPFVIANGILIKTSACSGDVIIPDSVTSIGDSAFSSCTSLTSITIPDSVTSIGDSAFSSCTSLTSITIPDSVTSIGDGAFSSCTSLTSITIPDSVTSIGGGAFRNCSSLPSVIIPDSVTSIGGNAFYGTPWLTAKQEENPLVVVNGILIDGRTCSGDVTIPDSVTSIGEGAFYFCDSLTSVTIPNSVTSIGDSAFNGCENLTSITFPDSVTSIGVSAFSSCTSLTSVTIPDSVTSIKREAFFGTPWLTAMREENPLVVVNHILIDGGVCSGEVTISEDVTSIGEYSFYYSLEPTSVIIPDSVTSIGELAFYCCNNLTNITILNPDCKINGDCTISNYYDEDALEPIYNGIIHGYDGSTAQAYAEKYGYTFESLGDAPETPTLAVGNVNGDTEIDASDAADLLIALANLGAGEDSGLTADQEKAADTNGDGELDAGDAAIILQYAAHLGSGGTGTIADFLKQ